MRPDPGCAADAAVLGRFLVDRRVRPARLDLSACDAWPLLASRELGRVSLDNASIYVLTAFVHELHGAFENGEEMRKRLGLNRCPRFLSLLGYNSKWGIRRGQRLVFPEIVHLANGKISGLADRRVSGPLSFAPDCAKLVVPLGSRRGLVSYVLSRLARNRRHCERPGWP